MDIDQRSDTNQLGIVYIAGNAWVYFEGKVNNRGALKDAFTDTAYAGKWPMALVKKGYTVFSKSAEELANGTRARAPSLQGWGYEAPVANVPQHLLQFPITARLSSATLPASRKTPVEDCFLNRYHSLQNKSV